MKESLINSNNIIIKDEEKRLNKDHKEGLDIFVADLYPYTVSIT